MKKIASYALALCLMLSTFAGIGLTAMAEPTVEGIAITGVTEPTAGGNVTTAGITGVPEGFDMQVSWQKYNYADAYHEDYEATTFADDSVYLLHIILTAQGDNVIPLEEEDRLNNATVNGAAIDEWDCDDKNEVGFTHITLRKLYFVGDITIISGVEIASLPAVAAGASTAAEAVQLPADAGYKIQYICWHTCESWEIYEGATLAENGWYDLEVFLVPLEGYWLPGNATIKSPVEVSNRYYSANNAYLGVSFDYDLRPVVKTVSISDVPEPVYGGTITTPSVTVPAADNYTATAKWTRRDNMTGMYTDVSGTFVYGEYILQVTVTPKAEYIFDSGLDITIDGVDINDMGNWHTAEHSEQELILYGNMEIAPQNGYVNNISLSGAPGEITAGAATVPTLTVDEGEVTVSKVQWVDQDYAPLTDKFEDGNAYYLAVTLAPAAGYALREGCNLEVKKDDAGYEHPYLQINADSTGTFFLRYSLLTSLDKIEITVTEPKVGGTPAEPKVPAGAKYSIANYIWYEDSTGEEVTTFENGKKYYLELMIETEDGYETTNDTAFTVNGKKPYEAHSSMNGSAYVCEAFSFKTKIDRVDITMPVPTLGGTGGLDTIKLPTDAKYTIDTETSCWNGHDTMFEGTFEKDKYTLDLYLLSDEGYEYAKDAKVYLNGELYDDYSIYRDGDMLNLYYQISFRETIDKVAFPALPTVKVGDDAPVLPTDVPDGAHYTLEYEWIKFSGNYGFEPLDSAFENGGIYYLFCYADPDEGYEFAEDAEITVGGKAATGCRVNNYVDSVDLRKLYSFGVTVIDKVELTVEKPAIGKKPGKVTVPENAGYKVMDIWWYTYETDDFAPSEEMRANDTFAAGNYYWVNVTLETKDGYVLADELTYVLNGEVLDLKALAESAYEPYSIANYADIVYGFGKLEEPAQDNGSDTDKDTDKDAGKDTGKGTGTHAGKSPLTGDAAPVALLSLMAVSMAGVAITLIGKKKYCR